MPGLQEILFHILCIAWLRDLQSETCLPCSKEKRSCNMLVTDLSDEYIFGYVQRVLTSAEVLFFPQNTQLLLLAR